jgi:hypothetical protein
MSWTRGADARGMRRVVSETTRRVPPIGFVCTGLVRRTLRGC